MAGSLKDQLLKAGIASKKQVKKVELDQRKKSKQSHKKSSTTHSDAAISKETLETARKQKIEKDRALNEARKLAQQKKATQAEIRQLVAQHRIPLPADGEIRYQFLSMGKVKQIWINAEIQRQLSQQSLLLVCVDDRFELVPPAIGDRIIQRDPNAIIKEDTEKREKIAAEEAEYADYQIPDDLDW